MRTHIEASVRFKRPEDGGRASAPVLREYCPYLRVDPAGEMLAVRVSEVLSAPKAGEIRAGEVGVIRFELMYPGSGLYDALSPGARFEVLEGPRVIGTGEVLPGPGDLEGGGPQYGV